MANLEIKKILKNFSGKRVLNDININVKDGELISLLGPSGCGKSTTLKIVSGLIEPDSGDIVLNGESILKVPVEKRGIALVFQEYLLFPHLNVEKNIGFGLKMAKADKKIIDKKVREITQLLELNGMEKKYPRELSGGQKQRVALGRALAVEPSMLLLDEPFSNLDIRLRDTMREMVLKIQKDLKITTILVTHDREEALMMSDRVAVMINGQIMQYDSPRNIYENPISPVVADFFGDKNYIEGALDNNIFKCELGSFKINFDDSGSGRMMIRPENIEVHQSTDGKVLTGVVQKTKYVGDKVYYNVLTGSIELRIVTNSSTWLQEGQIVGLSIDFSKGIFYKN